MVAVVLGMSHILMFVRGFVTFGLLTFFFSTAEFNNKMYFCTTFSFIFSAKFTGSRTTVACLSVVTVYEQKCVCSLLGHRDGY
jgi:hypothetical protein